jgi:Ca-activated chloride channel family protein
VIPASFHFLRPAWLLALVPLALVAWAASRSAMQSSAWRRVVDAHLLRHLLLTDTGTSARWPIALGAIAGVAAITALAGPAWDKLPQPTFTTSEPTVVVLDLSPQMQADDLPPTRIARARLELHDLLERNAGGQVGLVLYSDEPFVAAPLTDDGRLIEEMIPTLDAGLMPLRAPRADRALLAAKALLDQAGAASGRVVLITSAIPAHADETLAAARTLAGSGRTLSVLGAGTDDGAPSRDARGRIDKDAAGQPVLAKLDRAGLEALAKAGNGRFSEIRADDTDLAIVAPAHAASSLHAASAGSSAQFDVWRDAGIWLVLIPLAAAPFFFRRGLVAALALSVLAAAPARAEASTWDDLWSRRDQQGQAALAAGDAAAAAGLFEDPAWQAAATYQSGSYDQSIVKFASLGGGENTYNLGNALAKSGKLEDAVKKYDEVLKDDPEHADAKFNRDLVQRLLDEQRRQQQQQQQQQQGQSKDQPQGGQQGDESKQQQNASGQSNDKDQRADQPQSGDGAQQPRGGDDAQSAKNDAQHQDKSGGQQQSPSASADDPSSQQEQQQQQAKASDAGQPEPEKSAQGADAQTADADDAQPPQPNNDAEQQANAKPDGDQQQQQQQQTARNAADAKDDEHAGATRDAAAEQRNETAQQDRALEHDMDQALAGNDADAADDQPQDEHAKRGSSTSAAHKPMTEQEQAREQALRNIPDDPAGLLRAKIRRQYAEQRYSRQEASPSW